MAAQKKGSIPTAQNQVSVAPNPVDGKVLHVSTATATGPQTQFQVRPRTQVARPKGAGRKAWDLEGLKAAVEALGAEEEVYLTQKASIVRAWLKRNFPQANPFRTTLDKDSEGKVLGISIVRKRDA